MFHELAGQKESRIVEGHLMPNNVVAHMVGYIKGKSDIQVARRFGRWKHNFTGEHFRARGYFILTVGLDAAMVRLYP